jgi:hypothetical protein
MLKFIRNRRTTPLQDLVLLLLASWLLPALLLLAVSLMAGCGGGHEDDTKDTEPVDCKARPELCA